MVQMRTKPQSSLKVLEEQLPLPKRSYIYAIHVDGVLRYIGKGTDGRMYAHMKEVRQRLTRKFKLKNIGPLFQRKLTEAVMKGAVIEEIVLADNLTSKQAYKLEHRHLERLVYAGNREQLWNAIPPSIYTPQEYQAYIEKLTENSTSKDRLTRVIARMQLIRLGRRVIARMQLEPISKSSEEHNEAGELDKAEEVLGVILPADEDAALPLDPSEEALDQPASHVAA
jgi:hypothetical protein